MCILVNYTSRKEIIIGRYVYVRDKKTLPHEPGRWDQKKKLEAVTTWLATGNLAETARLINVPVRTVTAWKYEQDWWDKLVSDIQQGEGQKTDNKMTKIIDRVLDKLVDRIEDGDYQYDQRTGKMVKIPLKARDLERITSGLFDKRQLIRKQPTNIKQDSLNQAARLVELAEQFAKLSGQKVDAPKLVDEYIIDGEWEQIEDYKGKQNGMLQETEEEVKRDSDD